MNKKQTAVVWLREQFHKVPQPKFGNLFEQALQMEREQIIQAASDHCYPTAQSALNDAEVYYEQHYGNPCTPQS